MSVFIDTSAFLAVLDADDQCHQQARGIWELSSRSSEWSGSTRATTAPGWLRF
ncbi:MAG: hypothetical protein QN187_08540 [Armatimonadota bacterium]|nr:hypothetical protein [Armatimonadota bacterium]